VVEVGEHPDEECRVLLGDPVPGVGDDDVGDVLGMFRIMSLVPAVT